MSFSCVRKISTHDPSKNGSQPLWGLAPPDCHCARGTPSNLVEQIQINLCICKTYYLGENKKTTVCIAFITYHWKQQLYDAAAHIHTNICKSQKKGRKRSEYTRINTVGRITSTTILFNI